MLNLPKEGRKARRERRGWRVAFLLALLWAGIRPGLPAPAALADETIRRFVPRVVAEFPHDPGAWTQGLLFHDGGFYESTGLHGRSSVRRVALASGAVERIHELPAAFYGEGLARIGDRLFQVTWKNGIGFVYGRSDFRRERTFAYEGQGWGLTSDGRRLILSDGSAYLRFFDPETFEPAGRLLAHRNKTPVRGLNELEWVRGKIFANVWPTDRIVVVDPESGRVTGEFDLSDLRTRLRMGPRAKRYAGKTGERRPEPPDVANGIAYDAEGDRLFVTGKFWPKVFEIVLE